MESEASLPHSQKPAICPYPEPDRSRLCPLLHPIGFVFVYLNTFYWLVFLKFIQMQQWWVCHSTSWSMRQKEGIIGNGGTAPNIFNFGKNKTEWSASCPGRFTPCRKKLHYRLNRRQCKARNGSNVLEKRKTPEPALSRTPILRWLST